MSAERPVRTLRPDQGFTLLEVIVALMIAGFALAAMLGSIEAGLAGGGRADHGLRLLSVARSQLDGALAMPSFRAGAQTYDVPPHYHSSVDIRQIAVSPAQGERASLGLFSVEVRVWEDGTARSVSLSGRAVGTAVQE